MKGDRSKRGNSRDPGNQKLAKLFVRFDRQPGHLPTGMTDEIGSVGNSVFSSLLVLQSKVDDRGGRMDPLGCKCVTPLMLCCSIQHRLSGATTQLKGNHPQVMHKIENLQRRMEAVP
eukprot:jgi/Botrbrau1/7053/Bobra.0165s0076.1